MISVAISFFEQEEDKKMRSYAVIPPMMLDSFERRHFFNNKNGLIEDPMSEYKERLVSFLIDHTFVP